MTAAHITGIQFDFNSAGNRDKNRDLLCVVSFHAHFIDVLLPPLICHAFSGNVITPNASPCRRHWRRNHHGPGRRLENKRKGLSLRKNSLPPGVAI
jgi:hypothetical protein